MSYSFFVDEAVLVIILVDTLVDPAKLVSALWSVLTELLVIIEVFGAPLPACSL